MDATTNLWEDIISGWIPPAGRFDCPTFPTTITAGARVA